MVDATTIGRAPTDAASTDDGPAATTDAATTEPGTTSARARRPLRPAGRSASAVHRSVLALADRFQPQEAVGLDATWVVRIVDHGAYTIEVRDGRCLVSTGAHPGADATVTTDVATWLDLTSGHRDGVGAFSSGRLTGSGDLNLALRLDTMFRPGSAARRFNRTLRTTVRGIGLESFVVGRGPPVLLLHGLGASKVSFLPTIDGLADRFEVHALDLPGFGRSDKPLPTGRRYHVRWMADVVHDYMLAHRIRQAHLVGNSMGGRIATEVALRHPRRVAGIVGLGPAVAFDAYQWLGPALRRLQGHWIGLAPLRVRRSWVEAGIAELFADPGRVPSADLAAAVDQVLHDIRDRRFRLAVAACARQIGAEPASGRRSFWRRLETLRVPSYWIWGAQDRLSPPRYAERVAHHARGARVQVWPDTGHVPQYEHPTATNAAIRGFISALGAT